MSSDEKGRLHEKKKELKKIPFFDLDTQENVKNNIKNIPRNLFYFACVKIV
jgi:hypothetical protein